MLEEETLEDIPLTMVTLTTFIDLDLSGEGRDGEHINRMRERDPNITERDRNEQNGQANRYLTPLNNCMREYMNKICPDPHFP